MLNSCPQCGAIWKEELNCQSVFDELLILEFTDPGYGQVHFLTVACFMVQHGKYSDEGLVWIAQNLRDHLNKGIPVQHIRRRAAQQTGQDRRNWKVTRDPHDRPQAKMPWSMTIMDVASGYQDAASYRDLVTRWARATLDEMQPLLPDYPEQTP